MNVSICNPEVQTLLVGAGEALGVHPLGSASAAFHLTPGTHSRRSWLHTRREGGVEATGWTIKWGAGLEETADHGVHHPFSPVGKAMMEQRKAT
jgi:hypothetical protein